jgi:hypothetical protein
MSSEFDKRIQTAGGKGESISEEMELTLPHDNVEVIQTSSLYNLSLDSFVNLFTFLDTVSLLRFLGVAKLSRNLTDITSIWTNRWMWKNGNLLESFPTYFFHGFSKLKFVKNRSTYEKRLETYSEIMSKTKCDECSSNSANLFNNITQREYEYEIPGNTNKLKADFTVFRNVDVTILEMILKISVDLSSFSDLADFYLYNSTTRKNSSTLFHDPENGTIRTMYSDVSYFHSLYLLTIIIDHENESYSKEMRRNFLRSVCGDIKCQDLAYFSGNIEDKFSDKFNLNISLVDVILSESSIRSIARMACLFVRSQIHFFKWNETLDLLIPEYNRSPLNIESKNKQNKTRNTGNENKLGEIVRFLPENSSVNMGMNKVEKEEVVEESTSILQEGFMIIGDAKMNGKDAFCDRSFVRDVINGVVSLAHREIFKGLASKCTRNVLKAKVSRMDRTEVCGYFYHIFMLFTFNFSVFLSKVFNAYDNLFPISEVCLMSSHYFLFLLTFSIFRYFLYKNYCFFI